MPTRPMPAMRASRAEWEIPGESFVREARMLMRIPAIPAR